MAYTNLYKSNLKVKKDDFTIKKATTMVAKFKAIVCCFSKSLLNHQLTEKRENAPTNTHTVTQAHTQRVTGKQTRKKKHELNCLAKLGFLARHRVCVHNSLQSNQDIFTWTCLNKIIFLLLTSKHVYFIDI